MHEAGLQGKKSSAGWGHGGRPFLLLTLQCPCVGIKPHHQVHWPQGGEAVSTSAFTIETDPTPEQVQYLEERLYEFNSTTTGIRDGQGLAIFVRDERGHIVAGICGHTWGGCCEIRQL